VTFVRNTTENDETRSETEIATHDGIRARIDVLGTHKEVTA